MQKYILKMVHFHLRTIYLYTMEEEKKKVPTKGPNLCTQVAVFTRIQQNEVLANVLSCK